MKVIFLICAGLFASSVSAQKTVVESVEEVEGGIVMLSSRTFKLPDEIGFAFVPYVECLSNGSVITPDDNWRSGQRHSNATAITERCHLEKTKAIFLAATVLERLGKMELEDREALILETLEVVENSQLLAPIFPGMPSTEDLDEDQE